MAGIKPDWWIRKMARERQMIEPFAERHAGKNIISFGLQPCGYDLRLDPEILVFDPVRTHGRALDPLEVNPDFYFKKTASPYYEVPPRSFVEGISIEYLRIPNNCTARGVGKTIYSSVGLSLNISGINAGWEGRLRLHIANPGSVPIRIYGGQGIVYLEFSELDGECEVDYGSLSDTRFHRQKGLT